MGALDAGWIVALPGDEGEGSRSAGPFMNHEYNPSSTTGQPSMYSMAGMLQSPLGSYGGKRPRLPLEIVD